MCGFEEACGGEGGTKYASVKVFRQKSCNCANILAMDQFDTQSCLQTLINHLIIRPPKNNSPGSAISALRTGKLQRAVPKHRHTIRMCGNPRLRQQGEHYASTEISLNIPSLGNPFQRTKIPLLIIPHHYHNNRITLSARCNEQECPFHHAYTLPPTLGLYFVCFCKLSHSHWSQSVRLCE